MKAAVVDIKGRYAAVLAENGEVKKIVNDSYSIGDTLDLDKVKVVSKPVKVTRIVRRTIAVAAAVIVLAVGAMATAYAIPYGTVSVEGEPSIEYTINCFDYVIGVRALNESGEKVLSDMDENELRHHKVDDVVAKTVEKIKNDGYISDEDSGIDIKTDTGDNEHTERLQKDLNNEVHNDMGIPERSAGSDTGNHVNTVTDESEQQNDQNQNQENSAQLDDMQQEESAVRADDNVQQNREQQDLQMSGQQQNVQGDNQFQRDMH